MSTVPTSVPTTATSPATPSEVDLFFGALRSLAVEAAVSMEEAIEAVTLFSVVTLLLGSSSTRQVGNETKDDVLGVLTLYYGLQDNSLPASIPLDTRTLWNDARVKGEVDGVRDPFVRDELKNLRDELDRLGADVQFLYKEAKRQFNLGLSNDAPPNTEFPRLFRRLVAILVDPLMTIDIRRERDADLTDKERVGRALDLLVELKSVILRLVRSLSKYGTIATSRANLDWTKFERRALGVLTTVAETRYSNDVDDKTTIAVIADLTGKNRDTVVAPYIVMARNGGELLRLALDTYKHLKDAAAGDSGLIESVDPEHVLDLFQLGPRDQWRTEQMRRAALLIDRYPLPNWG